MNEIKRFIQLGSRIGDFGFPFRIGELTETDFFNTLYCSSKSFNRWRFMRCRWIHWIYMQYTNCYF